MATTNGLSRTLWSAGIALSLMAANDLYLYAAEQAVATVRDGAHVKLSNGQVCVALNEADNTWTATWPQVANTAIRHIGFKLDVAGQPLALPPAKAAGEDFSDEIGSGVELHQQWNGAVKVERRIRIYDNRPAIVVTAQITNHSDRDVALGRVQMLDVSAAAHGQWQLGPATTAPAAVTYPSRGPVCRPAPQASPDPVAFDAQGVIAFAQPETHVGMAIGALAQRVTGPTVHAEYRSGQGGTRLHVALTPDESVLKAGATLQLEPIWLAVERDGFTALEHYGDAVAAVAAKPIHTGANALWCSWYPLRMTITEDIALAHGALVAQYFKPLGMDTIQLDHGWQRGDICGDWHPNERFPHGLKWLAEQLKSRYGLKLGLWIAPTQVANNIIPK